MDQFPTGTVLTLLIVGCALFLLYYICQKFGEYHNDPLAREVHDYEMGRRERRGASFGDGDGDREGGNAAARDIENATAGGAGGALEGEDTGDIGLARTLPLEG
ncbi:hypothetical protein BELL_0584g00070 [Botrytis elliptica]|uniref:Uncharacterized protein n=1 Tax=Botrytis elliptica TaxID=278938 RepID=A0A4Z1JCD7_9HELO|nr:hypothetical protein EAE99_006231 [Botrytis elliptica]TGO71381.1 hypothetical protein BELL_0584g00070 [Botrytis elliptica]